MTDNFQVSGASEQFDAGRERRRSTRHADVRPVKVFCVDTGKYLAGRTCNISTGGMLLHIDHPSLLVAGQRIKVGIAPTPQHVLLRTADLHPATVVRSLGHGGAQSVALSFDAPAALAIPA